MSANRRRTRISTGRDPSSGPVLLLLVVVVLVPTACLLWFMTQAIRSQRRAARQELADAYRAHLSALRSRVEAYWSEKIERLEQVAGHAPGSRVFAESVGSGLADSVVCYDAGGQVTYPAPPRLPEPIASVDRSAWADASERERGSGDLVDAAAAYAAIAEEEPDANLAARALQAEARCLVQAGRHDEAIRVVTDELGQPRFGHAVDAQGRLIVANAELMALELMGDASHPGFGATADRLRGRLTDYGAVLPASQRRFLMKALKRLGAEAAELPTLAAEDLAARFVATGAAFQEDSVLGRTAVGDVWQLACPSRRAVALFRTETLVSEMQKVIAAHELPEAVSVSLMAPGERASGPASLDWTAAGASLPGWQLALRLNDGRLLESAADEQTAAYLWTGFLVIAAILVLAVLIARLLRRQMRLTRLKNDLVASVSHELKTPLASIRLLVDTLLDAEQHDEPTVREYLELVAKENARLTRLIENFLAFSRMERNKHAFELKEIAAGDVVQVAADAVRDRFSAPGCRFDVQIAPDLPPVVADADALVTALVNLLDNAYKYSNHQKHIVLRAYAGDGRVYLEVADNGIGLSRRAAKRVFDRFYQVDRRLSRPGGGCGLGLSIVRFIVDAHGGTIRVASQPGRGSTFTVTLPRASSAPQTWEEGPV